MTTRRLSTRSIIAATYSTDVSDVGDHHQRERGVYVMGDDYLTCSPKPPGGDRDWQPHPDQFWAAQAGTTLWIARPQ